MSEIEYSETSDTAALDEVERQIAAKYMRIVPWGAVAWAFCNLAVWLSLWPLVLFDIIPLWLGFIIASIIFCISYTPFLKHVLYPPNPQPLQGSACRKSLNPAGFCWPHWAVEMPFAVHRQEWFQGISNKTKWPLHDIIQGPNYRQK